MRKLFFARFAKNLRVFRYVDKKEKDSHKGTKAQSLLKIENLTLMR
jgi:hypothetical protein